jgi:hypothetical protein
MYVAVTRSMEHMTLIHHYTCHFLPFLDTTMLSKLCECESVESAILKKSLNSTHINKFRGLKMLDQSHPNNKQVTQRVIDFLLLKTAKNAKTRMTNITTKELCSNVKAEFIDKALTFIHITNFREASLPSQHIDLATKTNQSIINESVSEINETAVPSYYEFINTGKMTIVEELNSSNFIKITSTNNTSKW